MSDSPIVCEALTHEAAAPCPSCALVGYCQAADEIPEDRPCFNCGKNPAEGFSSVWNAKDGERWFCHGDDTSAGYPTCYESADQNPKSA